jgi:two-component system sensor histidine kinase RegB
VDAAPIVSAPWLIRFRWAVAVGAAAALLVGWVAVELRFDVRVVVAILLAQVASNIWLAARVAQEQPPVRVLGALAMLDVVLLTALMLATGGPSNPFTITYLVFITLAATTLDARWTWAITLASIGGYGLLFVTPLRSAVDPHALHVNMQPGAGHQVGMWAAFLVAAVLTASFVTRIRAAVEARERALAEARRMAAQRERLASLTTLAAGAAHELATPLSTIAVTSRELDLAASAAGVPAEIAEDARLIRSQVERCREILDHMSGRADAAVVDPPAPIDASLVVREAIDALPAGAKGRVHVTLDGDTSRVRLPRLGVARVLTTLIKNALDASAADTGVEVAVRTSGDHLEFAVSDAGQGMDDATLARAGEPFFTTKPPGSGFGLGLFLARTFVEQWGGRFSLQSTPGRGTVASISFTAHGHSA